MGNIRYIIIVLLLGICFPVGAVSASSQTMAADGQSLQSVPEARFREIFHEFVRDRLGKIEGDTILSRFKVNGNRPVPAGVLSFQLFQKSKGSPKRYVRLVVIVSVDGISRNEVRLSGWVDVFEKVVCTTRAMQPGEIVKASDVYLARKNISRLSTRVLTDIQSVIGLMLKRDIKENICLKAWMLKKKPIVKRGDIVTILAERGGIKVTASGMIMEKGFSGEMVKVRNTMSKKHIYARIINDTTVMVDF